MAVEPPHDSTSRLGDDRTDSVEPPNVDETFDSIEDLARIACDVSIGAVMEATGMNYYEAKQYRLERPLEARAEVQGRWEKS